MYRPVVQFFLFVFFVCLGGFWWVLWGFYLFIYLFLNFIYSKLCEQFQEHMVTPVTLKYIFESMKTVLQ